MKCTETKFQSICEFSLHMQNYKINITKLWREMIQKWSSKNTIDIQTENQNRTKQKKNNQQQLQQQQRQRRAAEMVATAAAAGLQQ